MKRTFFIAATAFLFTISTAFAAATDPVPSTVARAFTGDFREARKISWKTTADFYKASFDVNGTALEAFYSYEGELIGLSRNITVQQLPLALLRDVTARQAEATVTSLFELNTDRGTEYFITYSDGKETKTFKSSGAGWTRY